MVLLRHILRLRRATAQDAVNELKMRLARSRLGGAVIGWVFAYMSFLLPVDRLIETQTLIAFRHPTPAWDVHILIVPKQVIGGVQMLGEAHAALLGEVFSIVNQLVPQFNLESYRVIVNGGEFQEVKQLHFHLVSGKSLTL